MTTLLQRLIEYVWIFYTICIIGAIVYLVRALSAHKERDLALFTLERETATTRAIQAWVMFFVFIAAGIAIFISTTYFLPDLPAHGLDTPLPTTTPRSGVEPLTPAITPTPTGLVLPLPTLTPITSTASAPTSPPQEPTEPPTPVPTEPPPTATPAAAVSGELYVRFDNFAVLVGYSLPAADATTSEPLQIALYWQGGEGTSPTDYSVFTHLLSEDGRLIAQHDGVPANGTRPTTTWGPAETIVDSHPMTFKPDALDYTGPATIAVGLYDPSNPSSRVATSTGEDYVVLPVTINIVPR